MTLQLVSQLACFSLSNWDTSRIRVLLACCICRFMHMVYELLLVYYSLFISKIIKMTYNLEWREYLLRLLLGIYIDWVTVEIPLILGL
jgi:hypothetical protein